MLELQPLETWSATSKAATPAEKIKGYSDYLQASYFKAGALDDEVYAGITAGARDYALANGLLDAELPEEEQYKQIGSLIGAKPDVEKDARFLYQHYALDFDLTKPEFAEQKANSDTLRKYFAMQQANPAGLPEIEPLVAELVGNADEVRNARIAALDRKDTPLVAVTDVDGRRQVYPGSGATPEYLRENLDSLLSTGVIDAGDLNEVRTLFSPINGGKATVAEEVKGRTFEGAVRDLTEKDPALKDALDESVARLRRQQELQGKSGGELVVEGALQTVATAVMMPFEFGKQLLGKGEAFKTEPKNDIVEILTNNEALLNKGYSEQDIRRYAADIVQDRAGPAYRADKPESGIVQDSRGNMIIAPALVTNKALYEQAVQASNLNEEQRQRADSNRANFLTQLAPDAKRLIVENDDAAAAEYAAAKGRGETDEQFVENWVANKGANYSGFTERLQQLGNTLGTIASAIPLGLAALSGSETATKAMLSISKDATDRREYARLMGDEFGLTFQIVDAVPQLASQILLTVGTGAAYTGLKAVARAGARKVVATAAKNALSLVDDVTANAVKSAARVGGEATMSTALKKLGSAVGSTLKVADESVPMFASTFYLGATNTYVSIYGQLPETMSHEDKHRNAIGYAIGSGLSTAALTLGMGFLGRSGAEDLVTKVFRPLKAADEVAAGSRVIPLDKLSYKQAKLAHEAINNSGVAITDTAFKTILRVNLGGAYKNYLRNTYKGFVDEGVEETIDTAISIKIEDAALKKDTSLIETANQLWHSFVIGGALGGGVKGITELAAPMRFSERVQALQTAVDVSQRIANTLRDSGSAATAAVFERNMGVQVAALREGKKAELAVQQETEQRKGAELTEFTDDGQAVFEFDDETETSSEKGMIVGDLIGERVNVGAFQGVLQRNTDGSFSLKLDKPINGATTVALNATAYQPLSKANITRRTVLPTLGTQQGNIAAGTPYIMLPNKARVALPTRQPEREQEGFLASEQGGFEFSKAGDTEVLTIRGSRIVGTEDTMDLQITDPNQINNIVKYYGLKRPTEAVPDAQFELPLFDLAAQSGLRYRTQADVAAEQLVDRSNDDVQVEFQGQTVTVGELRDRLEEAQSFIDEGMGGPKVDALIAEINAAFETAGLKEQSEAEVAFDAERDEQESILRADLQAQSEAEGLFADRVEIEDALSLLPKGPLITLIRKYTAKAGPQTAKKLLDYATKNPEKAKQQMALLDQALVKMNEYADGLPVEKTKIRTAIRQTVAGFESAIEGIGDIATTVAAPTVAAPTVAAPTVAEVTDDTVVMFDEEQVTIGDLRSKLTQAEDTLDAFGSTPALVDLIARYKQAITDATTVVDTTPTEAEQEPDSELVTLQKEFESLLDPVVTLDKRQFSLSQIEQAYANLEQKIEGLAALDRPTTKWLADLKKLETVIQSEKQKAQDKRAAIEEQMSVLQNPSQLTEGEGALAKFLKAIEGNRKPATERQESGKTKGSKPTTVTESDLAGPVFRTPNERTKVEDAIANGYLISNLAKDAGFSRNAIGKTKTTLFSQDKKVESYSLKVKRHIYSKVQELYPFVAIPDGTPTLKSKFDFTPMDSEAKKSAITLPVVLDGDEKATEGVFTNDPRITAAQLDYGLAVKIPDNFYGTLNPSITAPNGLVISVRLSDTVMVTGKGDLSNKGTTSYNPTSLKRSQSLVAMFQDPAAEFLPTVGAPTVVTPTVVTPTTEADPKREAFIDKVQTSSDNYMGPATLKSLVNKAISAGYITDGDSTEILRVQKDLGSKDDTSDAFYELLFALNNPITQPTPTVAQPEVYEETKPTFQQLLLDAEAESNSALADKVISGKYLDEDGRSVASISAIMEYASRIKQSALAEQLRRSVATTDEEIAAIVKGQLRNPETGNSSDLTAEQIEKLFKSNAGIKGAYTDDILASYGKRVLADYPSNVLPVFIDLLRGAALRANGDMRNANKWLRTMATRSINEPVNKADPSGNPAILLVSDEDVFAQVAEYQDSLVVALDTVLNRQPQIAQKLSDAISEAIGGDLLPMSNSELIDLASVTLSGRSGAAVRLQKAIRADKDFAIGFLSEGFLTTGGITGQILTPAETRAALGPEASAELRASAIVASMARDDAQKRSVLKAANKARQNLKFSRSDDNVQLTGAARAANSSELNRLGIVSGDPESVLNALRKLAKTGDPNTRMIADLLSSLPDLIRNTSFVIGDFDDVRFAGAYMPKSNLVVLNLSGHNGRGVVDVLLHEYIHAATTTLLFNPTTAAQRAAVARIEQLRKLVTARVNALGYNNKQWADALGSNDEFLTYALTDPKFQALIKLATPTKQRSLFTRLVEAMLEFFGLKKGDPRIEPIEELLSFTNMLGSDTTFLLSTRRMIRNEAREVADGMADLREFLRVTQDLRSPIQEGDGQVRMATTETPATEAEGEPAIDPVSVFRDLVPANIEILISDTLRGEAAVIRSKPNTIFLNPALLANRVAGLNASGARAAIASLVDHELGHIAINEAFTNNDLKRVAGELGTDRLQQTALDYYGETGLSGAETLALIEADRKAGTLTDSMIADEWLRMQATKAAIGRTFEQDLDYALSDPSLYDSLLRAINAFVTSLRNSFAAAPTTETAAGISRAERMIRQLKERGPNRRAEATVREASFGDLNLLLQAIEGATDGDRVSYSLAYMSSAAGKVERSDTAIADKLKLYNLPSQLRALITNRTQAINSAALSTKSFIKKFPKLRDQALAGGVAIEDIRLLFGTTAPELSTADQRDIELAVKRFSSALDPALSTEQRTEAIDKKQASLQAAKRNKFRTEFRKRQQAAEQSVRAQGFPDLVDQAVALRKDINRARSNGGIGFDESDDIYLTRTYRFFTTTGWSLAAKYGSLIKIDGKDVDFHKLRETAAKLFAEQADAYFAKIGKPYSNKDVDARTVELLDQYLETLEKVHSSVDKTVVDSLRKDLDRFKPKKDIDGALRALLGEIDDPLANAVNTLHHVSMLSANENFRKSFAEAAIATGLASKTPFSDWRPVYPASTEATMGPLAGLYMEPKAAAALLEAFGSSPFAPQSNSTSMVSTAGTVLSRVSGAVVFGATKLGFGYWPRNGLGGFLLGAAQGILWNPLTKDTRTSLVQAVRTAFSSLPTDEEKRNAMLRLTELGVLNDTALGRETLDLTRGLLTTDEQVLKDMMADVEEARLTGEAGGIFARMKQKPATKALFDLLGKTYTKPVEILTALDAAIDGAAKANAYYFELNVIEKHYGDSKTTEEKEVMAARKIKLTFPSHSQRYDPVKAFGRSTAAMLVVPFIGWKSEVFRTMSNTPRLAMQEIKEGGSMAVRGWRRLLGFTITLSIGGSAVGGAITALFQTLTDDEEEEDRKLTPEELASLREALPIWQRGHTLHARLMKDGKVQFVDLSSLMPYSQLTDMGQIIIDGIQTGDGIDSSRLASYVATQLLGTQIAATAVFEAANNEDDFGNSIYVETDPAPVKMERMFKHLLQSAIKPAGYKFVEKVTREGNQQRQEQLLGEVFGGKLNTLDNAEIQRRAFRGLKALQDSAHSTISEVTSGRYMDQDRVDDIVDRHQDAVNESQRRLSRFMGSMLDMGSNPDVVAANAAVYRFSKPTIESSMQGYRIPWVPNDKWFETVYRNVLSGKEQDPVERILMIRQAASKKPDVYWVRED